MERIATVVRRSPLLRGACPLWKALRPGYIHVLSRLGENGLERSINGTDTVRVAPELYTVPEVYEPAVWQSLMREVRAHDFVADVGAHIGLYTVAIAKRVGSSGRVYAFEPDAHTRMLLQRNICLNAVDARVQVSSCVVGDTDGTIAFVGGGGSESHVSRATAANANCVPSLKLDTVLDGARLDLLKIDVEGFEEHVLLGATTLLNDIARAPRAIFIEAHPFAWDRYNTTSRSLLGVLRACDYSVFDLAGNPVSEVNAHGEIVARRG